MTWQQRWLDCLFLHFPVPPSALTPLAPPRLEIETFGGWAYLTYVLFRLRVRPAWLPGVAGFSSLAELNIRTYVRHRGQSGICFLRVLADNRLAIAVARTLTPMPYEYARIRYGSGSVRCEAPGHPARRLDLEFTQPTSFAEPPPSSLDAWLLERYRLFIGGPQNALLAADAEHAPWQVAAVRLQVRENSLAADLGLALETQPVAAHYSPGVGARFQPFRVVAAPRPAQAASTAGRKTCLTGTA